MGELTDRERAILDMEGQVWAHSGYKDQAIRERFDLTPTAYYQIVATFPDRREAWEYAPQTVRRLRASRDARRRAFKHRGRTRAF